MFWSQRWPGFGCDRERRDARPRDENAYEDVRQIHFHGMHYRKDIGQKGLKRW